MSCPAITELCAAGASSRFEDHLRDCVRCRALVARSGKGERLLDDATEPQPTAAPGPPPKPGDVWTFWAPTLDELVVGAVIEAGSADVLLMPLLMQTRWAADADIGLAQDVLGYEALAAVWASDRVLVEQVVEAVSVLSEVHLQVLTRGYDAFFAGEQVEAAAGPPVIGDSDPRLAAYAALADQLRPLYAPWSLLHVADELGPVLGHGRQEADVELEAWSEQIGTDARAWAAFEAAEIDPYEAIPVKTIARAVRCLGLLQSRRAVDLAHASVLEHHVVGSPSAPKAMARRRKGVAPAPRRQQDTAREAADRYAAALEAEFGL
jgi:hypothetical protein